MRLRNIVLCVLFLSAIVCANLAVTFIGISALPYTAFILIPFDLIVRDVLHDEWEGSWLYPKMGLLILSGGLISYLLNADSANIALASVIAFTFAGMVDTFVYHIFRGTHRVFKMNTSNFFSSITDSILFPLIAFGVVNNQIALSQSSAKFFGGMIWSFLFVYILKKLKK